MKSSWPHSGFFGRLLQGRREWVKGCGIGDNLPGLPRKLNAITDVRGVGVKPLHRHRRQLHPHRRHRRPAPPGQFVCAQGAGRRGGNQRVWQSRQPQPGQRTGGNRDAHTPAYCLSVGVAPGPVLVEYKLERNPEIGRKFPTVNGVVAECNDGFLNDIRARAVTHRHVGPPSPPPVMGCPGKAMWGRERACLP